MFYFQIKNGLLICATTFLLILSTGSLVSANDEFLPFVLLKKKFIFNAVLRVKLWFSGFDINFWHWPIFYVFSCRHIIKILRVHIFHYWRSK